MGLSGLSETTASKAIKTIQAAAFDPTLWGDALDALTIAVGGSGALLAGCNFTDSTTGFLFHDRRLDADRGSVFLERHQDNIWSRLAMRLPIQRVAHTSAYIDQSTLRKQEFYHDVLAPQRIYGKVLVGLDLGARYDTGGIAIARRTGDENGAVTDETIMRALEIFTPHLQLAARTTVQIRSVMERNQALEAAFDRIAQGFILVDANARILFANATAREVLELGDGLRSQPEGLSASRPADSAALRALIARAARAGRDAQAEAETGGALPVQRPSGAVPLSVVVTPLPPAHLEAALPGSPPSQSTTHYVAIFIAGFDRSQAGEPNRQMTDMLRQLYGLTPAQTRVTLELIKGQDSKTIARALGVSVETVRTHVKGVLERTGCSSRSMLTAKLMNGPLGVLMLSAGALF